LFWRFYDTQAAVRAGDLKWIRVAADRGLYDVAGDCTESGNLLSRSGADAEKLQVLWKDWDRENIRKVRP
jgi:hypothetical protein